MFDVTKQKSFDSCVSYIKEIRNNSDKDCIVYLIGNKIDLENIRQVSRTEAENFSKRNNIKYFETSAVENNGVKETFEKLINGINIILLYDNKFRNSSNQENFI